MPRSSPKSENKRINENYVFIQAFTLFQKAEIEEQGNYVKALNLYKQSLSLIDSIPERFPSSSLALKIAQRQFRIGKSSYARIRKKIDSLRVKASKEELLEILHDCARNLSELDHKAEKLGDIALMFWENKQQSHCMRVFAEASDAVEDISDPAGKGRALNMLALKYAEIGEYERALTLSIFFSDLSDQIRLLTDLANAYYGRKMRERGRQLFFNAIELAERAPDAEQFAALVSWIAYKLAESEEYFWALEVAESIKQDEYKLSAIHQIVEKLISSGKFSNIQEFTRKIDQPAIKSELMTSLANKYARDGYFSQAREAAETIEDNALKAQALICIAAEYKDKSHLSAVQKICDEAFVIVNSLKFPEARMQIKTKTAAIFAFFKQQTKVVELMESAVKDIEEIADPWRRSDYYSYLIKTALELDLITLAEELCSKISEDSIKNKSICEIARRHAQLDNFALAQSKVNTISTQTERIWGYFQIIDANPENRNLRAKINLLSEITEQMPHLEKDPDSDRMLSECAVQLAKLERFHNALQVQESIKSDVVRDELLWNLAVLKFKADFFIEGIEILRLICDPNKRISRLIQLGVGIYKGTFESKSFAVTDFLPIAFSFWLEEKEKFETEAFHNKL